MGSFSPLNHQLLWKCNGCGNFGVMIVDREVEETEKLILDKCTHCPTRPYNPDPRLPDSPETWRIILR
jgi:hypothetical protein